MRRNKLYLTLLLTFLPYWALAQQPLTLDSCLQLARHNSAAIRQAELEIERAQQVRMQAMTKYFPQIQANAVAFHALEPIIDVSIDDVANTTVRDILNLIYGNIGAELGLHNHIALFQHGFMVGATAVQPIFMGGKIIAGNQLAKLGVEAAELQEQITRRDALEQVEESYWLIAGLQDKQRTLRQASSLLDTVDHLVRVAIQAGLALETDRMQIEIRRAELNRQRILLESGLRLANRALAQSIGRTDTLIIDANIDSLLSVQAIDIAETAHPEASSSASTEEQLLALQTRAAALQRTMTIADALPKVALGANYSYSQTDANILQNGISGWNGALFATVSIPLTGWWETGHKIREQSIRLEEAQLTQQDMSEKLLLRKQQAYDNMMASFLLVEETSKTVQLARRRLQLAELAYQAGTGSITDLLTAQTELLTAENTLADARIALCIHYRRYVDLR